MTCCFLFLDMLSCQYVFCLASFVIGSLGRVVFAAGSFFICFVCCSFVFDVLFSVSVSFFLNSVS